MKNIFIIPNPHKDNGYSVTKRTVDILKSFNASVSTFSTYTGSEISNCNFVEKIPNDTELIIVVGGDGSFIDAACYAEKNDIPIIGVNLGKVGYLNEVEPDELEALGKIFSGEYNVMTRMLLEVSSDNDPSGKPFDRYAVNDVVISNQEYMGISDFVVYSKDGGIRYRADGAVISTPQGSTAYSLSAGGPVVSHEAGAIILTPIAPHSFFNRSIVFGENEIIRVKNTSGENLNITIDGRLVYKIKPSEKITVKASKKRLKVLTFKDNNMFSNLFRKMQILEDII